MKAIRLKTEYLKNPLGIDFTAPRLFWNCADGVRQTAYQVICRDENENLLWDSGKIESGSMHTIYAGTPLHSRVHVVWQVRLWDENDVPGDWSEPAVFELGLLHADDWRAQWITGDYIPDPKRRYPVDCFKTTFVAGEIKKARLYATACGVYQAALNGQPVEGFTLAPGITDYRKRVQYQTYDVTALVQSGENALTVQLADGWYRGCCGAWGLRNQYGTETKFLAQLELTLTDGTVQTVCTDGSWQWSNDGPVRFADNKDGERIDARRTPTYSGHAKMTTHPVQPTASDNEPLTEHERLAAKILHTPSGRTVLDFGQNIAGILQFTVQAKAGQRICLRFGEMLDENGEFTQKNIQTSNEKITSPLQQVDYVCKAGRNDYKTAFQSQIPPLTDDEFKQLEENILKEGKLLSPLIVWGNTLVDGHNRYAILQKHPEIYFSTMPLHFANREEALAWICKNQLGRRNLSPEQKRYLLGKQYESALVLVVSPLPNPPLNPPNVDSSRN